MAGEHPSSLTLAFLVRFGLVRAFFGLKLKARATALLLNEHPWSPLGDQL